MSCYLQTLTARLALSCAALLLSLPLAGVSAQTASDVVCGGCVDTNDIANEAVTFRKIKLGAVGTGRLADGAVTAAKLADDAVFVRTIVVSPVGNPTVNGTALLDALASTFKTRWLIKIEPGIYDVGATPVIMKPFVDIEGSGQGVTLVRGDIDSIAAGVVNGADNSELRNLTVQNMCSGLSCVAINTGATSVIIKMVTAKAISGINLSSRAVIAGGGAKLDGVTALASSGVDSAAVEVFANFVEMNNVFGRSFLGAVVASRALLVSSGEVLARNSRFIAADVGAQIETGTTATLVSTQIDGATFDADGGGVLCSMIAYGLFKGKTSFFGCPTILPIP